MSVHTYKLECCEIQSSICELPKGRFDPSRWGCFVPPAGAFNFEFSIQGHFSYQHDSPRNSIIEDSFTRQGIFLIIRRNLPRSMYAPVTALYWPFKAQWLLYVPHILTSSSFTLRHHKAFMSFVSASQWAVSYYPHNKDFLISLTMNGFVLPSQWIFY